MFSEDEINKEIRRIKLEEAARRKMTEQAEAERRKFEEAAAAAWRKTPDEVAERERKWVSEPPIKEFEDILGLRKLFYKDEYRFKVTRYHYVEFHLLRTDNIEKRETIFEFRYPQTEKERENVKDLFLLYLKRLNMLYPLRNLSFWDRLWR